MNLTQILAWLSGPTVGSAFSYVLDQWKPWHDWKPAEKLGFDLKAVLVTLGSLLLGFVAYEFALRVPEATINALDPYIAAAFPLLTMIFVQLWHAFVNKRLEATAGVTTTVAVSTGDTTTTLSGPATKLPEATAVVADAAGLELNNKAKG